jgi:hypothetical protein
LRRSALLLAGVAVLAGCAGSHESAGVTITGGTKLERKMMSNVIQAFHPRTIKAVRIAGGDVYTTRAGGTAGLVRAEWEDWIVAYAYKRRLKDRLDPDRARFARPPKASAAQARAVVNVFWLAAHRAGARVPEATGTTPYAVATAVTLRVTDPKRFLKYKLLPLLQEGPKWSRYEGQYVALTDSHGRRFFESGNSTRAHEGQTWVLRGFAPCYPGWSLPAVPGKSPPTCPA